MRYGKYGSFAAVERAWEYRNLDPPSYWEDEVDNCGDCECCGRHFEFDPKDFCDCDEDGPTYDPPTMCEPCRENGCDWGDEGPCPVAAECACCGEYCPETGCVECFRYAAHEWFENSTTTYYGSS